MFGHYFRTLDDKRRLVLPSKFRDNFCSIVYATFGPDSILELRSEKDFAILRDKILSNNILNKTLRKYSRLLFGNTLELNIDKLGRINIPDNFLSLASIEKEVVFVGVGNKVELLSKSDFEEQQNSFKNENSLDKLSDKLFSAGVNL